MEDEFKKTLFAFILASLFGLLMATVVLNVGGDYGADSSQISGSLSLSKFNDSITNVDEHAQNLEEKFEKGSVWSTVAGVVVEGIFGIGKEIIRIILLPFGVMKNILIDVFQIPTYVTDVILALFLFGVIFSIWRLIKVGY